MGRTDTAARVISASPDRVFAALTDPDALARAHFFGHCANRRRDDAVGRQDLAAAVDAQLFDQQAQ
jgi:uncharacterized protein YndB with AHSA1/START domain